MGSSVASPFKATDAAFMGAALGLARRGLGRVWPNPAVGCVLVRDGRVVGRGWTGDGGRPHAETEALGRAGDLARGAVAYVTLEPCAHHGKTPPCADALIAAGVARAVVAIDDPDPRVAGRGLAAMRNAGIAVETGLCAEEAAEINAGFLLRIGEGRPMVTLKSATSLDGRIATQSGESRWITGPEARALGHRLRAEHDAVMVGSGTAIADDPDLTCRLPGLEDRSPLRVVADGRLRLSLASRLVATAERVPTWILTREGNDPYRVEAFAAAGVEVIELPAGESGEMDLREGLRQLAARGITRLLVEGGAHLAAALLRLGVVDRLAFFRGEIVIGGDGVPAAMPLGFATLAEAPHFRRVGLARAGADLVEYLVKESD